MTAMAWCVLVTLPGAGCATAQVLAGAESCAELRVALAVLADLPPHP